MKRDQVEELFYGKPDQQKRFTQDFPILPDVWIAYAEKANERFELLLTPHSRSNAATLAQALRERLKAEREVRIDGQILWKKEHPGEERPRIIFNESVVLAYFSFWEVMRVAMPLTDWWGRAIAPIPGAWTLGNLLALAKWADDYKPGGSRMQRGDLKLLKKLIGIAGTFECERKGKPQPPEAFEASDDTKLPAAQVEAFANLFQDLTHPQESRGLLWTISLNRKASTSVWRSRMAVKADAASWLFAIKTAGIRWAVLDTGIDARHPAFARRKPDGTIVTGPEMDENSHPQFPSRIVRTYDFLRIKDLLNPETEIQIKNSAVANMDPDRLKELKEDLQRNLERSRAIDWDLIEPFLRIPHDDKSYVQPGPNESHGTHVAGILAANWEEAKDTALEHEIQGMCPDLELYDMRVLGKDADEFTVIAALQFVRHINAHKDLMEIHGVNLSMSVPHDVANYACGRTPVCEECERVVASGVVVVTAAGNRGFNKLARPEGGVTGDYRYISITDPGNADSVITVGSTHRFMPHNYGVSYFSSRGPTGDGRSKPDLVAPGERIDSCSLDNDYETMDGTSMAAPHVSGAAVLLIARHRELVGQPKRVKEILCKSATDLGRETRFQGCGMLDVLRALQSV
jgi:serine protease AprX